jgi:glutamine cyclotransferase
LKEKRKVKVQRQRGSPAYALNELEFINGHVLANVWYQDVILVIDPVSGTCIQEYGTFLFCTTMIQLIYVSYSLLERMIPDFSNLWTEAKNQKAQGNVLNGISSSSDPGVIYITGKKWESVYKIKLRHFP